MSYLKLGASLLFSSLLVACGGSGGTSGAGPKLTGQIIDSPVDGLLYVPAQAGEFSTAVGILEQCGDSRPVEDCVTANGGQFGYRADETVFFFLGDLPIGKAPGAAVVILEDLQAISETDLKSTQMNDTKRGGQINDDSLASQAAVNKAILLQALDSEGDLSDGIQIDFTQLPADSLESIDFNMAP